MGFGLLFIGYLFMFSFPYRGFDILPDIIGFVISYIGLRTLSEYGCGFDNLKKYFSVLIPASVVTLVVQLLDMFGVNTSIVSFWEYAYTALILLFNILLIASVYKIADDTELKSIKAKAQRNLVVTLVYYVTVLFFSIPVEYVTRIKEYLTVNYGLGFVLFVFGYIWMFLNLSLLFSCYMRICKPGDEDMPIPERKSFLKKDEEKEEN